MRKALAGLTAGFVLTLGLIAPVVVPSAQAADADDPFCVSYATEMANFESLQDELDAALQVEGTNAKLAAAAAVLGKITEAFQRVYEAGAPATLAPDMESLLTLFRDMHAALATPDFDAIMELEPELEGEAFTDRLNGLDAAVSAYCAVPEASATPEASPTPEASATPEASSSPTSSPTAEPSPTTGASPVQTATPAPSASPSPEPAPAPSPTNAVKQTPYCLTFQSVGAQLAGQSTALDNVAQAQTALNTAIPLLRQLLAAGPPADVAPTLNDITNLFTRVKTALDSGNLGTVLSMKGELDAAGGKIDTIRDRSMTACNIAELPNTGATAQTTGLGIAALIALGLAGLSGLVAVNYRRQAATRR
jgi:LPXTG-motif cell wall-anchored protein